MAILNSEHYAESLDVAKLFFPKTVVPPDYPMASVPFAAAFLFVSRILRFALSDLVNHYQFAPVDDTHYQGLVGFAVVTIQRASKGLTLSGVGFESIKSNKDTNTLLEEGEFVGLCDLLRDNYTLTEQEAEEDADNEQRDHRDW